jgi:hypothetical protein
MSTVSVSTDNILQEVQSTIRILQVWENRLKTEGVPEVDYPSSEEALERFLREFTGEMILSAGKLSNLAMVLSER